MAGILAQVGDQLGPFVPRDLDRGNGSDKSSDLVAQTRLFSGKRTKDSLLDVALEDAVEV